MFGGGGNTGGGFGSTNNNTTTGGFGANTGGGFGAGANPPPNNGTANTPFQPFSEKDGTSGNAQSQYQTITFQQPYQNYSLEELRVADYNQGRRYGNQNGQAGAFGQSTGFGGFGSNNATAGSTGFGASTNTGGSLFGGGNANTATPSAFGQSTGGAFGSNNNTAGGGLFGQNKPATGGLFGSNTNTTTGTTGGLFGGAPAANTTGGFGSGGGGFGASPQTGGGLFGQNKPAATGGLFGSTGTAANTASTPFGGSTNTGGAFGQSNTGGGGLFGQANNQPAATPAFGANNTTTNTGGGLFGGAASGGFGQNNQAPAQNTTSGGLFGGGGGFGQANQTNQPKPGGLFGGASTGTAGSGLFGGATNNNNSQPSGGLFGNSTANNANNTSGGLFGQKPATGGSSLFGGNTANTGASGGGLFGGLGTQNNQPNTGGSSLFGGQNNQPKPGGMFGGSTTNNNTGGGLFGGSMGQQNTNQSNLGGSMFSSTNQQPQQQQQQNNNSLFGASGSSLLNTSMATNPYGNDALFAGLATPTQSPGPIATPLSSSQKNKKSAILPQHKLNPSASTRLLTPQSKMGGYGFSYSSYGTPGSSSSQNGSGFSGSLFANGSLSRSLALTKSHSASNLRNSYNPENSILSPGAFSNTGRSFGNGSLKKLNINRNLNGRTPLFDEPSQKRVSFAGGEDLNSQTNGETAMVVRQDEEEQSPRARTNGNGNETPRPEMQQVNGTELARVSEDDVLTPKSSSSVNIQPGQSGTDPKPGEYWSSLTLEQLRRMSKQELKSVSNFVVGRHNIGQITFHHGKPVDLSEVDLDKLYGDIVQLNARNATVYGESCTCLPKPPLGTALNQPSEIVLGNSWPRNRAGKKDVKHLERLKRVAGTTFIKYNQSTGEWTFSVPHFSSYGLDYDDYSDDEEGSSELSDVPDTPAEQQHRSSQMTSTPQDDSFDSPTQSQSSPDDTFDFKKGLRGRASVPGGFGDESVYEEHQEMEHTGGESFLGRRSVGSLDGQQDADYSEESESELAQDQSMADSVSRPVHTTEQAIARDDPFRSTLKPKSILKASQFMQPGTGTPSKGQAVFEDDWANQLQRTISPKKQDRQALRESQGNALREHEAQPSKLSRSFGGRQMTTAMDLMDSLFGETEKEKLPKRGGHGIEV
jgi:nuclear pore complex protein Nup98-Nup96